MYGSSLHIRPANLSERLAAEHRAPVPALIMATVVLIASLEQKRQKHQQKKPETLLHEKEGQSDLIRKKVASSGMTTAQATPPACLSATSSHTTGKEHLLLRSASRGSNSISTWLGVGLK